MRPVPRDRPSKAEVDRLIHDFGRYIGAGRHSPGIHVEQRLYDKFRKTLHRLQDRYPDVDLQSDDFMDKLRSRASTWWESRAFRGAGQDW